MRSFLVLSILFTAIPQLSTAGSTCTKSAWEKFLNELVTGQQAFVRGDPSILTGLWSHSDDVTLMGAWGGYERGWSKVGSRLEWVSKSAANGTYSYDEVSSIVGSDLALLVQIEHIAIPNLENGAPSHLRVTHAMRCEGLNWRIVSRHADRLTETRAPAGAESAR
jgi:hypothetical protein